MATRAHPHVQQQQNTILLFYTGVVVVAGAVAAVVPWVCAQLAAWIHSGQFATLSLPEALAAVTSGRLFSSDPASGYPSDVQGLLPGAWGFWSTNVLVAVAVGATLIALSRLIDARVSQAVADRRWYHLLLGRRPQSFGHYRNLRSLVVTAARPDRMIVGTIATPPALLAVADNVQVCAVAAPRSGKTSGLVIPALLEHTGPAVTTSVRTDVLLNTQARRKQIGQVFVWDPFGESTDCWDPLQGCESWEHALLVSRWLGHARSLGDSNHQAYFDEEAEGLTAPLLHAAALTADKTIVDVYHWVRDRDTDTPLEVLATAGAEDAIGRLRAVYAYTERQRDGIIGTASMQLKAYGHPAAARTAGRGQGITPQCVFDGHANTVYIVAGRDHQQLLAPLVVTMLSSLLYFVSESENRCGAPLAPPALFALDEVAQIAPIEDLPQILATSLPSVRFLTVWHSLAQMRERYGTEAAATILALSQAKIFLGSITDNYTRDELVNILGQQPVPLNDAQQYRDTLTAQALQRLRDGRGLLIHGELPPAFFTQRRYYSDRTLKRLTAPQHKPHLDATQKETG